MNAIKKHPRVLGAVAVAASAAITLGIVSEKKEYKRGELLSVLVDSEAKHGNTLLALSEKSLTKEQTALHLNIQAAYILLGDMIESNKQLHGFWSLTDSRLPHKSDIASLLEEIKDSVGEDASERELEEKYQQLQQLTQEFGVIMKKDESEINNKIKEGIEYISSSDIIAIQSYMSECTDMVEKELTLHGLKADYLKMGGAVLESDILDFIHEQNIEKSRKILIKMIDHYSQVYDENSSQLAYHHLTEIAMRLQSGDELWKVIGKKTFGVGIHVGVIVTGLSILIVMLYAIMKGTTLAIDVRKHMGNFEKIQKWAQAIVGITGTLWMNESDPKSLTDKGIEEKENTREDEVLPEKGSNGTSTSLPPVIDVAGEVLPEDSDNPPLL